MCHNLKLPCKRVQNLTFIHSFFHSIHSTSFYKAASLGDCGLPQHSIRREGKSGYILPVIFPQLLLSLLCPLISRGYSKILNWKQLLRAHAFILCFSLSPLCRISFDLGLPEWDLLINVKSQECPSLNKFDAQTTKKLHLLPKGEKDAHVGLWHLKRRDVLQSFFPLMWPALKAFASFPS